MHVHSLPAPPNSQTTCSVLVSLAVNSLVSMGHMNAIRSMEIVLASKDEM